MASQRRAVTPESLGAWLVKAGPEALPVEEHLRTGFRTLTTRCVRRSYRTELVEADQPVLLWLSGSDQRFPAGIYAAGRVAGRAALPPDGSEPVMPVDLWPVDPPVLRTELVGHPVLGQIEVLRMPAGSNPSYLTGEQLRRLRDQWPQMGTG